MKILVIEDSRLLRIAVGRMLTRAGHDVIGVADGQQGLRRAQDAHPDLILLDMMLPTMEGTSVLRSLKQNVQTSGIPVVVLSGLSPRNELRLKADGAAAFLEKSRLQLEGDGEPLVSAVEGLMRTRTGVVHH